MAWDSAIRWHSLKDLYILSLSEFPIHHQGCFFLACGAYRWPSLCGVGLFSIAWDL